MDSNKLAAIGSHSNFSLDKYVDNTDKNKEKESIPSKLDVPQSVLLNPAKSPKNSSNTQDPNKLIKSDLLNQQKNQELNPKNLDLANTSKNRPPMTITINDHSGMANPQTIPPVYRSKQPPYNTKPVENIRNSNSNFNFRNYYEGFNQITKMNYPKSGREKLLSCEVLTIRPKVMDAKDTTIESSIHYWVFPGEHCREQMHIEPMFVVHEKTVFCTSLLNANCRPYEIIVDNGFNENTPFLFLKKSCKCSFWCFNRPEIEVDYVEEGLSHPFFVGSVYHPFVCCNYELELFAGQLKGIRFLIKADSFAFNVYCCLEAAMCNKSSFTIFDLYNNPIGKIEIATHYETCNPRLAENDYFTIYFPKFAKEFDRMLLFSAMLFLTTNFFSNSISLPKKLDF